MPKAARARVARPCETLSVQTLRFKTAVNQPAKNQRLIGILQNRFRDCLKHRMKGRRVHHASEKERGADRKSAPRTMFRKCLPVEASPI